MVILAIKSYFNQLIHPRAFEREPAKRFETWTGLKGIAGDYSFPENMSGPEFEDACRDFIGSCKGDSYLPPAFLANIKEPEESKRWPSHQRIIFHAWQALIELNPQLESIEAGITDPHERMSAFNGVVSGFNVDDINLFLKLDRQYTPAALAADDLPGAKEMRNKIQRRTLTHMEWVASPQTLKKILASITR